MDRPRNRVFRNAGFGGEIAGHEMRSATAGFLSSHDMTHRPQASDCGKIRNEAAHRIGAAKIGEDVLKILEDVDRLTVKNICDFCWKRLQRLRRQAWNVEFVATRVLGAS